MVAKTSVEVFKEPREIRLAVSVETNRRLRNPLSSPLMKNFVRVQLALVRRCDLVTVQRLKRFYNNKPETEFPNVWKPELCLYILSRRLLGSDKTMTANFEPRA